MAAESEAPAPRPGKPGRRDRKRMIWATGGSAIDIIIPMAMKGNRGQMGPVNPAPIGTRPARQGSQESNAHGGTWRGVPPGAQTLTCSFPWNSMIPPSSGSKIPLWTYAHKTTLRASRAQLCYKMTESHQASQPAITHMHRSRSAPEYPRSFLLQRLTDHLRPRLERGRSFLRPPPADHEVQLHRVHEKSELPPVQFHCLPRQPAQGAELLDDRAEGPHHAGAVVVHLMGTLAVGLTHTTYKLHD
jgi:hypothetical protein